MRKKKDTQAPAPGHVAAVDRLLEDNEQIRKDVEASHSKLGETAPDEQTGFEPRPTLEDIEKSLQVKEAQLAKVEAEEIEVPANYAGSDLVKVQVARPMRALLPMIQGGDIVKLDCRLNHDTQEVEVTAWVASPGETFWINETPYKGAQAKAEE
jgi:hypothetical protein